jgi:hypothetical protein
MKAPLDPSEPLFPVRPNEPICQYYMKHGTCKFGQACKFNHPPQIAMGAGGMDGNTLLVGTGRKNDGPHMDWNSGHGQGIQVLPQRPGESNCIFFLKNGRCKYGATCRYHHPLNYHDRRSEDNRRQQVRVQQSVDMGGPKIHYVTQLPPGAYQQGHFVVADGTVAFISLEGSTPAQVISVPQGSKDGTMIYARNENGSIHRALGLTGDVQSSTSSTSIASSYETAGSNLDPLGPHGDSAGSLWNRPRKSGSGNSLNAYNIPENNPSDLGHVVQGNRTVFVQNADNPNQGLPRVVSTSSHASEGSSVYYDAKSYNRPGQHQGHPGGNPGPQWRGRRSSSFDHSKPSASSLYSQEEGGHESYPRSFDDEGLYQGHYREQQHQQQRSPMMRSRPPPGARPQRRSQQGREVDDGLSMMTSALLTMLDTPEEAAGENYDYDEHINRGGSPSEAPTPPMRQHFASARPREAPKYPDDGSHRQESRYMPSAFYYDHHNSADNQAPGLMMPSHDNRMEPPYGADERGSKNYTQTKEDQGNWYPNWQDASSHTRNMQENSQALNSSSNSPHASSNVGLYLP